MHGSMRCKKIFDARRLPCAAKEQLRHAAVKRVEAGEGPEAVAKGMGVNRRTIYRWLAAYHTGGQALQAKPIHGAPPKLTAKQMMKLANLIRTKNPLQLQFEFALWMLALVRALIRREFGVQLSEVSVGRLLKRFGFTPQCPVYRAWQQDRTQVAAWHTTASPKLAARAKRENALIFFADESGIWSDYHAGTTGAPKGQMPITKTTGARCSFNMLSAVNALGHFRFMTVEGSVTARVFRQFRKRLIAGMDRKILLIVDGHPTHKAKLVRQFVATHADQIELCFLPPYSPELNPDEWAWAHVKTRIAKQTAQTKGELKAVVQGALRHLQRVPHVVAGFFRAPTCAYAQA